MDTWKKILVVIGILVIIGLIVALVFGWPSTGSAIFNTGGSMDNLVKCLNEKGVVLFGFEGHLQVKSQLKLFGDAAKSINIIDCKASPEKCKGVILYPSWRIEGMIVSYALSPEMLAKLSGCKA